MALFGAAWASRSHTMPFPQMDIIDLQSGRMGALAFEALPGRCTKDPFWHDPWLYGGSLRYVTSWRWP